MGQQIRISRQQDGAALVISLILLMVLTLLAVSSMNSANMQEKMAGNLRDQNLAFQSAEAAVRDAEQLLRGLGSKATVEGWNGSGGLYGSPRPVDEADPLVDANWTDSRSAPVLDGAAEPPTYFIEYIQDVYPPDENVAIGGGYPENKGEATSIFRITARGFGGSEHAKVYIRSHFGRQF